MVLFTECPVFVLSSIIEICYGMVGAIVDIYVTMMIMFADYYVNETTAIAEIYAVMVGVIADFYDAVMIIFTESDANVISVDCRDLRWYYEQYRQYLRY